MDLLELESEIENYFDSGTTVELMSSPGVGKSDTIRYLVNKFSERDGFEWGLGIAFLATYTPIDLLGYMIPTKKMVPTGALDAEGKPIMQERLVSEYTEPGWLYSVDGRPLNSYKRAILFMDEYDKGDPDVKKTAAELFLHGQIGPHKLNPTVARVAASNRSKDRSGSTKNFDFVINRRGELHLEPSFASWEAWAHRQGMPPIFVLFAKKYPNLIFNADVPKDQGPWCTPRSYVAAVRLLIARDARLRRIGVTPPGNYGADDMVEGAKVQVQITGMIGEAAATQLMGWLKIRNNTPDFDEIVNDPQNTPVPSHVDAKLLTVYECAYHVNDAVMAPVCEYMKRFPKEFHVTFAKAACRRNRKFILNKAMDKFVEGNTALLNTIG